jgi:hypothetical protein
MTDGSGLEGRDVRLPVSEDPVCSEGNIRPEGEELVDAHSRKAITQDHDHKAQKDND